MISHSIITGEQPKISVWLDESDDQNLKPFHCAVCGKIAFEYYNNIKIMVPGEPGFFKAPKVIQCHGTTTVIKNGQSINTRCKAKYYVA